MARVSLEGVSKRYPDGNLAVRELTLGIEDRELLVVVGPSGCGKSTTLRLIAGLEEPTDGTIRIGDQIVNGWTCKQRNVAMVFQHSPLYPQWTVRQNLAFGWQLRNWKLWKLICPSWLQSARTEVELDRRLSDVADRWELTYLLDRPASELSGGERQRVGLGRAMLVPSDALLLDEPLGNLDAKLKNELLRRFKSRHQQQKLTTIYVTHDQSEGMAIADRIAVMKDGAIEQVGTPEDIYNRPVNQFVSQFISEPPINLLNGVLEKVDQGWAVRVGLHTIAIGDKAFGDKAFGDKAFGDIAFGDIAIGDEVRIRDQGALDRSVVLGLRPQHLCVRSGRPDDSGLAPHEQFIPGKIVTCEWVGGIKYAEVELDLAIGELETRVNQSIKYQTINCRVDERESVRAGDLVQVIVLASRALVFDSKTGYSLW